MKVFRIALIITGLTVALVGGLLVYGKRVWNTPYRDDTLAQLFGPSCGGGLSFAVTLKQNNKTGDNRLPGPTQNDPRDDNP